MIDDDEGPDSGFGEGDDAEIKTLTIVNSAENWNLLNMSSGISYWPEEETNSKLVLGFSTQMDRDRVVALMRESSNPYDHSF